MNVRHSFSIKNILMIKWTYGFFIFYFSVMISWSEPISGRYSLSITLENIFSGGLDKQNWPGMG